MRTSKVPNGEHLNNPTDHNQTTVHEEGAWRADAWQAIAQLALALSQVRTVEELVAAITLLGLPMLSAAGCGIITAADDGGWRLALTTSLGPDLRTHFAYEPHDSPLPACRAARNSETFFLADLAAAREVHPRMEEVVELTSRQRWALLPLTAGEGTVGSLAVSWRRAGDFTPAEQQLLRVVAAHVAPAVQRLLRADREHRAHAATLSTAAAFQNGVLPPLPHLEGLELAVSYRPARADAVIGGDWYDVLTRRNGTTLILVGDIAGHDQQASATMVHTRALFRGIAWDSNDGPARLLDRLDAAIAALQPGTTATAALVELTPTHGGLADSALARGPLARGGSSATGRFRLRWASAGHPPPLLRLPDGAVELLTDGEDPLLGVDWSLQRRQHHHPFPDGSVLVMATDGILETRERSAGAGAHALATTLATMDLDSAEAICRHLDRKTSSKRSQRKAQPSASTADDDLVSAARVGAVNMRDTSSALQDDRTLLVVRAHEANARSTLTPDSDGAAATYIDDVTDSDHTLPPHRELTRRSATEPRGELERQISAFTVDGGGSDSDPGDDGHRGAEPGAGAISAAVTRVISLPPEARSTPIARSIVRTVALTGGWGGDVIDTAELLVSEVVTNAVIHGRSDIRMSASCTPDRLLIEVEDGNDRLPELLPADPEALSGRGLQLIDSAADDWGAHRVEGSDAFSKVVWFSIRHQR